MKTSERITIKDDGHVVVRYITPREYEAINPYLEKTKINELVDLLNAEIYCCAIRISTEVKYPHCYGAFQS